MSDALPRVVLMIPGVTGPSRRRRAGEFHPDPALTARIGEDLEAPGAADHERVFVRGLAAWEAIGDRVQPSVVAAHSRGIYTGLVIAGCVEPAEALALERAAWKAIAAVGQETGTLLLAVIGGDDAAILSEVDGTPGIEVAIHNARGQRILGGERSALAELQPRLEAAGALSFTELPLPGAVHTSHLSRVSDAVRPALELFRWREPLFPVLDLLRPGQLLESAEAIRGYVVEQLAAPLHWEAALRALDPGAHDALLDLGPGDTLARIARWIDPELPVLLADGV